MITFNPIGVFHTDLEYPYQARRQAAADTANSVGQIRLLAGQDFEQALSDLEGFARIWILYVFHHNPDWKPKVMPPRGPRQKRGVFATRAPYRPNAIGMSCVRLVNVEGLIVTVEGHDLLNDTPILDIKPYLPYADSFPESQVGWLTNIEAERWQVTFHAEAVTQLNWLSEQGVIALREFIETQLEFEPLDHKRKRVQAKNDVFELAYRTWRVQFSAQVNSRTIAIHNISSGYTKEDLHQPEDPHADKKLHQKYIALKF